MNSLDGVPLLLYLKGLVFSMMATDFVLESVIIMLGIMSFVLDSVMIASISQVFNLGGHPVILVLEVFRKLLHLGIGMLLGHFHCQ